MQWAFNELLLPLIPHAHLFLKVDEIYHDESLGVHINIALVRLIMVGYRQVNPRVNRQCLREKGWGARASDQLRYRGGITASRKHFVSKIRTPKPLELRFQWRRHLGLVSGDL